jgi:hypothetical protein
MSSFALKCRKKAAPKPVTCSGIRWLRASSLKPARIFSPMQLAWMSAAPLSRANSVRQASAPVRERGLPLNVHRRRPPSGKHLLHDFFPPSDSAQRDATCDRFAERGQIGDYSKMALRGAGRDEESCDHLVENQKRFVPSRQSCAASRYPGRDMTHPLLQRPDIPHRRFDIDTSMK